MELFKDLCTVHTQEPCLSSLYHSHVSIQAVEASSVCLLLILLCVLWASRICGFVLFFTVGKFLAIVTSLVSSVALCLSSPSNSDQFSLVQLLSHVRLFATHDPQHTRPPCLSRTPRVYPNPCPLCQWCHPTISSSVVPFSSCLQSFPASGSFPMSQLFASGGQSIAVSASTSVPPPNTQDWSPLGWTGWISLQSKGLSTILYLLKSSHNSWMFCSLHFYSS